MIARIIENRIKINISDNKNNNGRERVEHCKLPFAPDNCIRKTIYVTNDICGYVQYAVVD